MFSLEKLCKAVVARNDQANLQPILNNEAWGASLIILVTDCLQNWNNFENGFLKTQNFFFFLFEKVPYL